MKYRRFSALDKFIVARKLPKFSFVFYAVFIFAWFSVAARSLFQLVIGSYEYVTGNTVAESVCNAIETQLILAQAGLVPWSCLIILTTSCMVRRLTLPFKIFQYMAFVALIVSLAQITLNFTLHLVNADNASLPLFVFRFVGLTIYVYLVSVVLLVCRMKEVSQKAWKVFDIIMLSLALFAFSGTVLQKVAGPLELISALAVVAGTIAFALKFARTTCEYSAIKTES